MGDFSFTEENYLKAIYHLSKTEETVSTSAIAKELNTKDSSVSDMLKKLAGKNLIHYVKYRGVSITKEGRQAALAVIRKHRLWEVFLVEKLEFNWDEVHEVAEQLEHIKSKTLIERLEAFLGFPKYDPHGDPIPDRHGRVPIKPHILLSEGKQESLVEVVAVKDSTAAFLRYLDQAGICIGAVLTVVEKIAYDSSMKISVGHGTPFMVSKKVSENILVAETNNA